MPATLAAVLRDGLTITPGQGTTVRMAVYDAPERGV